MVYGDPSRVTQHDIDESWAPSQFPSFTKATRQQLDEFRWERPPSVVMAQRLSALEREVLVLLGTRDRLVVDASRYVRELIDAGAPLVLRIAEGGGHAVNEERPVEVLGHTLRFLRW